MNEICHLFQYTPFLQYLKVSQIHNSRLSAEYHQSSRPVQLKQLILTDLQTQFNDLTHLLKKCSNLQTLIIGASNNNDMLDASRWERLIKYSLPSLIDLRFKSQRSLNSRNVIKLFERFQTSFWLEEHQWYTEYALDDDLYYPIYT